MKVPSLSDTVVAVRAYITDEAFGYDHWRAAQFAAPMEGRPAMLVIFATKEERDAAVAAKAAAIKAAMEA